MASARKKLELKPYRTRHPEHQVRGPRGVLEDVSEVVVLLARERSGETLTSAEVIRLEELSDAIAEEMTNGPGGAAARERRIVAEKGGS